VGAARYGGASDEMQGWNQVIVRSRRGEDLIAIAQEKGALDIREAPAQALQALKNAAAEKKIKALKQIAEKSRSAKNLLYLSGEDPAVRKYINAGKKQKGKS
jgi:coenzyme F420-reducing hydrogenase beta subunit